MSKPMMSFRTDRLPIPGPFTDGSVALGEGGAQSGICEYLRSGGCALVIRFGQVCVEEEAAAAYGAHRLYNQHCLYSICSVGWAGRE